MASPLLSGKQQADMVGIHSGRRSLQNSNRHIEDEFDSTIHENIKQGSSDEPIAAPPSFVLYSMRTFARRAAKDWYWQEQMRRRDQGGLGDFEGHPDDIFGPAVGADAENSVEWPVVKDTQSEPPSPRLSMPSHSSLTKPAVVDLFHAKTRRHVEGEKAWQSAAHVAVKRWEEKDAHAQFNSNSVQGQANAGPKHFSVISERLAMWPYHYEVADDVECARVQQRFKDGNLQWNKEEARDRWTKAIGRVKVIAKLKLTGGNLMSKAVEQTPLQRRQAKQATQEAKLRAIELYLIDKIRTIKSSIQSISAKKARAERELDMCRELPEVRLAMDVFKAEEGSREALKEAQELFKAAQERFNGLTERQKQIDETEEQNDKMVLAIKVLNADNADLESKVESLRAQRDRLLAAIQLQQQEKDDLEDQIVILLRREGFQEDIVRRGRDRASDVQKFSGNVKIMQRSITKLEQQIKFATETIELRLEAEYEDWLSQLEVMLVKTNKRWTKLHSKVKRAAHGEKSSGDAAEGLKNAPSESDGVAPGTMISAKDSDVGSWLTAGEDTGGALALQKIAEADVRREEIAEAKKKEERKKRMQELVKPKSPEPLKLDSHPVGSIETSIAEARVRILASREGKHRDKSKESARHVLKDTDSVKKPNAQSSTLAKESITSSKVATPSANHEHTLPEVRRHGLSPGNKNSILNAKAAEGSGLSGWNPATETHSPASMIRSQAAAREISAQAALGSENTRKRVSLTSSPTRMLDTHGLPPKGRRERRKLVGNLVSTDSGASPNTKQPVSRFEQSNEKNFVDDSKTNAKESVAVSSPARSPAPNIIGGLSRVIDKSLGAMTTLAASGDVPPVPMPGKRGRRRAGGKSRYDELLDMASPVLINSRHGHEIDPHGQLKPSKSLQHHLEALPLPNHKSSMISNVNQFLDFIHSQANLMEQNVGKQSKRVSRNQTSLGFVHDTQRNQAQHIQRTNTPVDIRTNYAVPISESADEPPLGVSHERWKELFQLDEDAQDQNGCDSYATKALGTNQFPKTSLPSSESQKIYAKQSNDRMEATKLANTLTKSAKQAQQQTLQPFGLDPVSKLKQDKGSNADVVNSIIHQWQANAFPFVFKLPRKEKDIPEAKTPLASPGDSRPSTTGTAFNFENAPSILGFKAEDAMALSYSGPPTPGFIAQAKAGGSASGSDGLEDSTANLLGRAKQNMQSNAKGESTIRSGLLSSSTTETAGGLSTRPISRELAFDFDPSSGFQSGFLDSNRSKLKSRQKSPGVTVSSGLGLHSLPEWSPSPLLGSQPSDVTAIALHGLSQTAVTAYHMISEQVKRGNDSEEGVSHGLRTPREVASFGCQRTRVGRLRNSLEQALKLQQADLHQILLAINDGKDIPAMELSGLSKAYLTTKLLLKGSGYDSWGAVEWFIACAGCGPKLELRNGDLLELIRLAHSERQNLEIMMQSLVTRSSELKLSSQSLSFKIASYVDNSKRNLAAKELSQLEWQQRQCEEYHYGCCERSWAVSSIIERVEIGLREGQRQSAAMLKDDESPLKKPLNAIHAVRDAVKSRTKLHVDIGKAGDSLQTHLLEKKAVEMN